MLNHIKADGIEKCTSRKAEVKWPPTPCMLKQNKTKQNNNKNQLSWQHRDRQGKEKNTHTPFIPNDAHPTLLSLGLMIASYNGEDLNGLDILMTRWLYFSYFRFMFLRLTKKIWFQQHPSLWRDLHHYTFPIHLVDFVHNDIAEYLLRVPSLILDIRIQRSEHFIHYFRISIL